MGSVYRVISPFTARYIDFFYISPDQTVSARVFASILGLDGVASLPKKIVYLHNTELIIRVSDLPKVLADLGRNPEDLKNLINPENLYRPLQNPKKRDREETNPPDLSQDLIKLFAKRYITENPQKVREVIFERLIGQNVEEFIKKL